MNFIDFYEMAAPRDVDIGKVYYHGTDSTSKAESIIKNGINPPDLTTRRGKLRPVVGKVYITPNLRYSIIYALGGDMLGHHSWKVFDGDEKYGYVFEINGNELKDIQPDEDGIGQILYNWYNKKDTTGDIDLPKDVDLFWLESLANRYLTPRQIQKIKEAEYVDWAVGGKKLVKFMTDQQKLMLIDLGVHIAHTGSIKPNKVWKIDKNKSKELKDDGSNFFEIAEENKL